jgi:Tol biopolymer transport system component
VIIVSAGLFYVFSRRSLLPKQVALASATFQPLTDQSGSEYFPSLSPDGKLFVYASYVAGNWDIYLQRVGGKNPTNLTKDSPDQDLQPAFSPDGERICFRSSREGGGIFVMEATGESVKRLTNSGFNPAWSPDGKEITYADESILEPANRTQPAGGIWAIDVASGEKREIPLMDPTESAWIGSPRGGARGILDENI